MDGLGHLDGQMLVDIGGLGPDDGGLPLNVRVLQIEVGAPPPQGLAQRPGAVGGQDDEGDGAGPDHPGFRDGDLHFAEKLQQERLEFLIGFVDLIDEQDHRLFRTDSPQQGAFQQVLAAEQGAGQLVRVPAVHLYLDAQKLLLIVPFVEGFALVQPFIALEAYQLPVQSGGHDLGDLGFAYARRALDEQGPPQLQRHQQGGGYVLAADIAGLVQLRPQGLQFHTVSSLC